MINQVELLWDILNHIPDSVTITNPSGIIQYVNEKSANIFRGFHRTLIGENFFKIINHSLLEQIILVDKTTINKIKLGQQQFILRTQPIFEGESLTNYVFFLEDADQADVLSMKTSITTSFMNIYEKVLSVVPIPMLLADKNARIIIINEEYAQFLGIDRNEAIGKHIQEIIPTSRVPIVLKTGEPEIAERFVYLDGREAIVHRIPIIERGEVVGCFGMVLFKDIKELGKLAQKIKFLENEMDYYKVQLKNIQEAKYSLNNIISCSQKMEKVKVTAVKAARSKANVLVIGESGVGKQLVVHGIHLESERRDFPLITVNCAAIPENLLESELFGYEEGAFTGAKKGGKIGRIELANRGTLFLDEIGDMPLPMQAKILYVIQEKELEVVGGKNVKPVDVRFIAATNKDLEKQVAEGAFRADLYYRLNVLFINIPPLRERVEDIPLLCEHFLSELLVETGVFAKFDEESLQLLRRYSWPGNVRELRSIVERILTNIDNGKDIITVKDIPLFILKKINKEPVNGKVESLDYVLGELERKVIMETLEATDYNKVDAAKMLKISRTRLYRKLERYGINK